MIIFLLSIDLPSINSSSFYQLILKTPTVAYLLTFITDNVHKYH